MAMPLPEWDTLIAPVLYRIQSAAQAMSRQARVVQAEVQYLMYRPPWLSKAEDEIDQAIAETEAALGLLLAAKKRYAEKEARE